MNTPSIFKYLLIGLVAGTVVSVVPTPLNLFLALPFVGIWLVRLVWRPPGDRAGHFVAAGAALATVVVAILLPVKQLDKRVDPFRYEQMSLDELCQALYRDHHVVVRADRSIGAKVLPSFGTDRVMTRREVLQKLARDVGCDLQIGYCGTGATLLFGAYPSFTRLTPRVTQSDGAAQGHQPIRLETNPTAVARRNRRGSRIP